MAISGELRVVETSTSFAALDGYRIGGTLFAPGAGARTSQAVLLVAGGGIPAIRYANFARYLAQNGIGVLSFDYRGIGRSKPRSLRGFVATIEDWSEYDCGGAILALGENFADAELVGLAHSIGSFLLGGAPGVNRLSRYVFIGAHTGFFGDYRPLYRWPMALLWHFVMPAMTRPFGYFPAHLFHLGEDIPRGVALQWAARRTADPKTSASWSPSRTEAFFRRCATTDGPAVTIEFTDDAFATQAGTSRFLREFPKIEATRIQIAPDQVGLAKIGHFGFFGRNSMASLWSPVVAYVRTGDPRPLAAIGVGTRHPRGKSNPQHERCESARKGQTGTK